MDISSMQRPGPVLPPQTAPTEAQNAAEKREIIQAVKAVNAAELFGSGSELTFVVDRVTQRPVIRLVDRVTKDIIRQIPAEYVLRMAEGVNPRA